MMCNTQFSLGHLFHRANYWFTNLKSALQSGGFQGLATIIQSSVRSVLNPTIVQNGIRLRNETYLLKKEKRLYGEVLFSGWAVSHNTLDGVEIEIMVDGELQKQPVERFAHPGPLQRYRDIPVGLETGYRLLWNSGMVEDGRHTMEVRAFDGTGAEARIKTVIHVDNVNGPLIDYQRWIKRTEKKHQREILREIRRHHHAPFLSIVLPLALINERSMQGTVESVICQTYSSWNLHIIDTSAVSEPLREYLNRVARVDNRVHVNYQVAPESLADLYNQSLSIMKDGWVVLLEPGSQLPKYALAVLAATIQSEPEADAIYSDHDFLDLDGRRCKPFFKPDWSPDLLRSYNYVQALLSIKKSTIEALGGFNEQSGSATTYDLLLRLSEGNRRVVHLPEILCHRHAESRAIKATLTHSRRALEMHVQRKGWQAIIEPGYVEGLWRIRHILDEKPTIAILIPSAKFAHFKSCLNGLIEATNYPHMELVLIDTSHNDEMRDLLMAHAKHFDRVRYVDLRNIQTFNFSMVNNIAMRQITSQYALFLNDDTYPINSDWLQAMVEHVQRPEIGCVGAKLLYGDGTIQHAGVVMGISNGAVHSFQNMDGDDHKAHYHYFPSAIRNVSAVTGACMLTKREVFWETGGFDEVYFPLAFQDVDYCLKVLNSGYFITYTPYAKLYHYESKTKSAQQLNPTTTELHTLRERWKHVIDRDPYYNPNLSRDRADGIHLRSR